MKLAQINYHIVFYSMNPGSGKKKIKSSAGAGSMNRYNPATAGGVICNFLKSLLLQYFNYCYISKLINYSL